MRRWLLTATLTALAAPAPAAAQRWRTEPVPALAGTAPSVILGPERRALVLHATPDAVFADRTRIAARTPGRAVFYDPAAAGAFLSDGSAVAVWVDERTVRMPTEAEGDDGCCSYLRLAHRPRGASRFGRVRSYPVPGGVVTGVGRIVTGPGGRFLVQFRGRHGGEGLRFGRGGRLGPPRAAPWSPLDAAFDVRGRTIVTHGDSTALRTSIAGPSGTFGRERVGAPLPVGPDRPGMIRVSVATAPGGAQAAVWSRRVGHTLRIEMARRTANGAFGPRRQLARLPWPDVPPARFVVRATRDGALAVVVGRHLGRWTVRLLAVSWSGRIRATRLGRSTPQPPDVSLAVAPDGRALLATVDRSRPGSVLRVARGTIRGGFGQPRILARRRRPIGLERTRTDAVVWSDGRVRLSRLSAS